MSSPSAPFYIHPDWQKSFQANRLNNFDDLWELELELADAGNRGRGEGGWSRVGFYSLPESPSASPKIVVKKQQNYLIRTWRQPVRGMLTFVKEFNMFQRIASLGIPVPQVVYCATRRQGNHHQAILVTAWLEGYEPLDKILDCWQRCRPDRVERARLLRPVAETVGQLHQNRLAHRCLYPKHLFVDTNQPQPRCCLIDLEKTRWSPWRANLRCRDLAQLVRHTENFPRRDAVVFLRAYLGRETLGAEGKKLWRAVHRQIKRKTH
ncbi:lipopolysaccharide kinase InaA family protein [Geoalkalibacter subterraneus]|uniref:lipopolysaccharide kinase InaA family protein n=1 Tax=Geoalkalibacter subterraneus TaxID=483547 RepID=UPI000693A3A9|nr:lipopolysaccharide kinase InaA family protein [Geoalkalibacter subterraneus]